MLDQALISTTVIALAGRRVDAPGVHPPRFPVEDVELVRSRLAKLFVEERAAVLICSAACGADLLGLEEAERLGLRRRVVLPFSPERFRKTSVVDRPGNWGPAFDRLVAAAQTAGDLVVLADDAGDDESWHTPPRTKPLSARRRELFVVVVLRTGRSR